MFASRSASQPLVNFIAQTWGQVHFLIRNSVPLRYDTGSQALRGNSFLSGFAQVSIRLMVSRSRHFLTRSATLQSRRAHKCRLKNSHTLSEPGFISVTFFTFFRPNLDSLPAFSPCSFP